MTSKKLVPYIYIYIVTYNILGGNPVEQFSSFQFGSFKPGLTSGSPNGSSVDDNFENGIGTLELLFQPLHLLGTCVGSIRHSVITIIDNVELNLQHQKIKIESQHDMLVRNTHKSKFLHGMALSFSRSFLHDCHTKRWSRFLDE